jgi:hypothetical protein
MAEPPAKRCKLLVVSENDVTAILENAKAMSWAQWAVQFRAKGLVIGCHGSNAGTSSCQLVNGQERHCKFRCWE